MAKTNYDNFRQRFEKRAAKKRLQSYFFLGISVLLLMLLFFFLHSGMNSYKNLKNEIQNCNQWTDRLIRKTAQLRATLDDRAVDSLVTPDSLATETLLESLTLSTRLYLDSMARANQQLTMTATSSSDENSLLIDTSARVLLALIGFFLIQIFLKLYRYNMETADFYTSLADALAVLELEGASIHGVDFEVLTKILRPSQIQLGIPQSPSIGDPTGLFKKGS